MLNHHRSGRRRRLVRPLAPVVPWALLLLLLAPLPRPASATVTVLSEENSRSVASYPSRPAAFGLDFEFGLEYVARVQLPPHGDLWLCGEDGGVGETDDTIMSARTDEEESEAQDGNEWEFRRERRDLSASTPESDHREGIRPIPSGEHVAATAAKGGIVVPPDGVPVVILARRGQCTYEQKAKAASKLAPPNVVRYVVVYDNINESKLIEMASESGQHGTVDGVSVGLLFISKASGQDLIGWITNQDSESREAGGPRLLLDGFTRWIPGDGGLDPMTWFGTILLGLGCLLSCTCLFVSETIREGGGNQIVAVRRRDRLTLLTEEEVRTLPEIVFREDGDDKSVPGGDNEAEEGEVVSDDTDGADGDSKGDAAINTTLAESAEEVAIERTNMTTPLLEASVASLPDAVQRTAAPASALVDPSPLLHENFDNTSCSICLEEYHDGCRLRVLPCHHAFHSDCIMPWLTRRSPTCPLCKAEFEGTGGDSDEEDEESVHDDEGDDEGADDDEEEAGTRVVANMLGIDLEAATARPPLVVRRREPEVSDDDESGGSVTDIGGFWRFVFGRRRLQDEEVTADEQVQELAAAAASALHRQQEEDTAVDEEGSDREEESRTAAEVPSASASNEPVCSSVRSLDDLESGHRSEELRQPLLAEEERSTPTEC